LVDYYDDNKLSDWTICAPTNEIKYILNIKHNLNYYYNESNLNKNKIIDSLIWFNDYDIFIELFTKDDLIYDHLELIYNSEHGDNKFKKNIEQTKVNITLMNICLKMKQK